MTDQPTPVLPPIPDTPSEPLQSPPPTAYTNPGSSNTDLPISEVVNLIKNYPPSASSGPALTEVGTPVVAPASPIPNAPISTVSTPPPEVSITPPPPTTTTTTTTTVPMVGPVAPSVSTEPVPKSPLFEDPNLIKTPGSV